ncbi:hypothetical protein CW696_08450 [ANME-2 cluster archaeon]|nr:MAG: hypothetical protein CW696_08450 [ANME-2 cluster archaeon]
MKSKLESRIDAEFERIGVKPYVYHVREIHLGVYRRVLQLFNGVTIATDTPLNYFGHLGLETIFELDTRAYMCPEIIKNPGVWMQKELANCGFYGVAICNRKDQYSRKRGRIIAKGRLLRHLKEHKP